ncbi:MAG: ATP synthase F1 subunit delta [bacterium]
MNKISNKQYAKALYKATKDLDDKDLAKVIRNFVILLSKKHKLKQANYIIAEFIKLGKKEQCIIDIEIVGARSLDNKIISEIEKIFGDHTQSIKKINKSLIGGLIIKTNETVFDASVKTQLIKMKQDLIN